MGKTLEMATSERYSNPVTSFLTLEASKITRFRVLYETHWFPHTFKHILRVISVLLWSNVMFETSSLTFFYLLYVFYCVSKPKKKPMQNDSSSAKKCRFARNLCFFTLKRRCYNTDNWTFFRFQLCLVVLTKPAVCFLIHLASYFDATP